MSLNGPVSPRLVEAMCEMQVHRGPDSRGIHHSDGACLGIQRLRIIDLETGDQPIYNEDRTVAVILNGEIYNFRELRRDLERRGHSFSTKSDTEVIVHLYEEKGSGLVHDLNGMFAFAVWDQKRRRLLLARDRVGKKPLFYYQGDGWLGFASELRALMVDDQISREIDPSSIDCYLAYGYIPAPWSIWKDVRKLEPAHTLVWEDGRARTERYWRLDYSRKRTEHPRELEEELRRLIGAAVRRRMIADVPLGAFLSGGVDSSIVVGEMAGASSQPVKTFSIGFEEEEYNELPRAGLIAERFATDHHEFVVKPDAIEILPKLVRHYGEPFADSSAIPSFYLAELTGRHVTVALNGDGGDESFAGYLRHVADSLTAGLDRIPRPGRRALVGLGRALPVRDRRGTVAYARRLLTSADAPAVERYTDHVSVFNRREREDLVDPEFRELVDPRCTSRTIRREWNTAQAQRAMDVLLSVDIGTYLPGDLLVKTDIATMAHSLEARSPLLDHDVMEFAASVPARHKGLMMRRKRLLRRAYRQRLPPQTLRGRKMGFAVPLDHWLRTDLADHTEEVLLDRDAFNSMPFAERPVRQLVDEHRASGIDRSAKLWALLMLDAWQRDIPSPATGKGLRVAQRAGQRVRRGSRSVIPNSPSTPSARPSRSVPRVSVVIPTHNRAKFVGAAVSSALDQALPPSEVIVVDDCSTDDTAKVLASFGNRIQVIRTKTNVERGAARNIGARAATGHLLAFLDSDDEWEHTKLARQLELAARHGPSVTGIRFIDADSTPLRRTYVPTPSDERDVVVYNPYLGSSSSLLIPRSAFEEVAGFPEARAYQGSEDWIFLVRLHWAGWSMVVVPEALVRCRVHPGGWTQKPENLERCMWSTCDWLDAQRLGRPRLAGLRRNGVASVIARAYIADGDWEKGLAWTRTAMQTGGPRRRLGNLYRVARTTGRRLLLPRAM